jgi:methylmalonyl-CoA mutase
MTTSRPESLFSPFPTVTAAEWRSKVLQELKGADYAKIVWNTPDGFAQEPWYNRETSLPACVVPFRKASNKWEICQQIPADNLAAAAEAAASATSEGADAIEFLFTEPGNLTEEKLATLFQSPDLLKVPLYFSGSVGDPAELCRLLSRIPGFDSNAGAILYDALQTQLLPSALPAAAQLNPEFRTLAVDTERFHIAGATIPQEIAIALAGVSEYLSTFTDNGISAREAAATIEVVLAFGTSHFSELAKPRALRALWPKLLEAYGVPADEQSQPRIFARASLRTISTLDPYTNILRLGTEAVSAILGGCDTLQLAPFDPAGSVSTEFSGRITKNIQLLLKEESGLDRVVDPAAGSWYIETMTASLCSEAWRIFQQIEAAGGFMQAESSGLLAALIAPAADKRQKEIRTRKRALIGVNRYTVPPSPEVEAATQGLAEMSGDAAGFEQLRLRALRHASETGTPLRAALWLHGEASKSLRVAAFAEDFLRCGGFSVAPPITLDLETASCSAILKESPEIVVLCWTGSDDLLSVPAISAALREIRPETIVIMASKPPENAAALLEAGLEAFIHLGSDAYALLVALQHKTGVA